MPRSMPGSRAARRSSFQGAALADPAGLLEGDGKYMRHVKLRPGVPVDTTALEALIEEAYHDVRARLTQGAA